jgi:hypothetical protein
MDDMGWMLYLVFAVLLFYFWTKIRGASYDELMERAHEEHITVHNVLKTHPKGGTYEEYHRWSRGKI